MGEARHVAEEFVEAFNAHDEARLHSLDREDVVFEGPGNVRLTGSDATTEYAMAWIRAFPDARMNVHQTIAGDGWAVQEFTFEGTHTAPMQSPMGEIPPTNRSLKGRGVQIFKVEGDAVVDTRLYYDQVQVMTQLGLMPEPATA